MNVLKKMMPFCLLTFFIVVSLAGAKPADELVLADSGRANYAIYYGNQESPVVSFATQELADYLEKIAGVNFPVTTSPNVGEKFLIVVGRNNPLATAHAIALDFDAMKDDGFRIVSRGDTIFIAGAIDRGTLYGVYHFLDIYLGVRWFAADFEVVPSKTRLSVMPMNDLQNPAFVYREIFNADTDDGYLRQRNRLNGCRHHRLWYSYPREIDTWSNYVPGAPKQLSSGHNFYEVVTSATYHYGGQLLAMSDGCRAEAANYFTNVITTYGTNYWYGFSQMDNGWEPDAASKAFADAHGGALSAPILDMVSDVANRVRQQYPDARFASYAYQFSFDPPTGMTIPDYVMIEAAPIHADFGKPFSDRANANIDAALRGWIPIARNVGVWDYIANFQNYLQPLPNIYPMCENICYLANLGYREYFGQSSYNTRGGEFAELRAWVASRLLWNPEQDYHALIDEFLKGYYGPAYYYIKQYVGALHQSIQAAGERLAVKQRITSQYLKNLDFILLADQLMASAEAMASGEYLRHVHEVRLGVDMTILLLEHLYRAEAEKQGITWNHDTSRRARFEQYVAEAGITQYSEDSNIDALYAAMDIQRVNPPVPDVAGGLSDDAWVDFQDMDFTICCEANLVADTLASDDGAAQKSSADDAWAIQMKLDILPTEGEWTMYAYVRVDPKPGAASGSSAFNMGIWPGKSRSVPLSVVSDGKYHVFKFQDDPVSFETGRDIWFSAGKGCTNMYVDRIVAVRKTTGIKTGQNRVVTFALAQNYPNPFNATTEIKFSIPRPGNVSLIIYDLLGRKVRNLIDDKFYPSGWHSITWDGTNAAGDSVATGAYLYKLKAGALVKGRKMILLK